MKITSIKDLIEEAVKKAFEAQLLEAYSEIETEMNERWGNRKAEVRKELKKQANAVALEMLQKLEGGISVEFKL